MLESGAPMLMLPPEWSPGPVGDNIVIAWNAGREALRAVHDAMPPQPQPQNAVHGPPEGRKTASRSLKSPIDRDGSSARG
jgi:hypothetical protein